MVIVEIKDDNYSKPISYYMDDRLKRNIDLKIIPSLHKKDKDCVLVIDGGEGTGKSTLAGQIGKYVDNTLNLKRITFSPEEFRDAVLKAKKGQCIIYDEAFTGLSSRASLSGINRVLVSLMMQMRQKNLFIILVLPTFFLLDKYAALFRTRALIHVYENKGIRGYFRLYNHRLKKMLYIMGKQTYSYSAKGMKKPVYTKFKGRFYGVFALGDEKCEENYRKQKAKALQETEHNPMSAGQVKYKEQRDVILYLLRKNTQLTYQQLDNLLQDYNIDISYVQIRNICAKFGDKGDIRPNKLNESVENNDNNTNKDVKIPIIDEIIQEEEENDENIDINDDLLGFEEYYDDNSNQNDLKEEDFD